jgi:hypothetical protein
LIKGEKGTKCKMSSVIHNPAYTVPQNPHDQPEGGWSVAPHGGTFRPSVAGAMCLTADGGRHARRLYSQRLRLRRLPLGAALAVVLRGHARR